MALFKDITGERYGRLTVSEQAGWVPVLGGRTSVWRCHCDCGVVIEVKVGALRSGNTQSCGCYHSDRTKEVHRTDAKLQSYKSLERTYKRNARLRKIAWLLPFETFVELTKQPCIYCGQEPYRTLRVQGQTHSDEWKESSEIRYTGIDRVDTLADYTADNCVPACRPCNRRKSGITLDMLKKVLEVAERSGKRLAS